MGVPVVLVGAYLLPLTLAVGALALGTTTTICIRRGRTEPRYDAIGLGLCAAPLVSLVVIAAAAVVISTAGRS